MQRIHIFRAGQQTASNGEKINFTEADLAATAAAYNPALHEAPIVVGHPANDDPAFGWVSGVKAEGANLFAEPHQVNAEFAEQVKSAAYKKVSASLYPKDHPHNPVPGVFYLRHVGFLGAMPPAIKGLKATEFAEDATCIELELDFSEEAQAAAAAQTEWKFPTAQPATKTAPTEPLSLPLDADPTKVAGGSPEGSTSATPADPGKTTPTEINTVSPEEAAALKTRAEKLEADLATAHTTLREQASAANTAAHVAFAEVLVGEARLTAADKSFVVATLDHLEPPVLVGDQAPALVEFGEGDAKKPMAEAFKDWLKALPKRVEFGEQAGRDRVAGDGEGTNGAVQYAEGTPKEAIDLDKRIRKYATDHKLSYAEAAVSVGAQR